VGKGGRRYDVNGHVFISFVTSTFDKGYNIFDWVYQIILNAMPSKKQRPAPLDLSIVAEDEVTRMITLSTKVPTQDDKPKTKKKRKMGAYDPQVYHVIEEIRQEVEEEIRKKPSKRKRELEDDDAVGLQQMAPENPKPSKIIDQAVDPDEPPPMVCPFHIELLVNVPNRKGYDLMKCPEQPCLISVFDKQNAESYLKGAYDKIHKEVETRWHELLCQCGYLPSLRQSKSEKNPGRMYLACRNHECKYFQWADEPLPVPAKMIQPNGLDYMVCPKHLTRLEDFKSKQGWEYRKCTSIPCFLLCGKDQTETYMSAVYKEIHQDICNRWEKINCFCGHYPILKQSKSEKNPGRLYLSCGDHNKCKFFRWTDEPVLKENFKDPLAVHDFLQAVSPIADLGESVNGTMLNPTNPKAPIYGESVQAFQQRLQQTNVGRNLFNPENFEKDYVPLHKDVVERAKLGLF